MTNREKFKDELDAILIDHIGAKDGKPVACLKFDCTQCDFRGGGCKDKAKEWLNAEYQDPPVDWSKVPIDTPVIASDDGENWYHRYFAGVSGSTGNPTTYNSGATSWSVDYGGAYEWPFMKLAEGNE